MPSFGRSRKPRGGSAKAICTRGRRPTGGDEVAAVAHAFNRMADDLGARQTQLAEADRARRQLLADVSHELMTPLTAIRGYSETLGLPQFGPPSPDGQRYVRIIQEEVERIERLVGDLLDLARYEASGMTLVTEEVPISELFDRVVARHEQAAREKGVTIDVRLADEELTVIADPRRLEQALQNLASNALRHTPRGGRITVAGEARDGRVWLRVADTGGGIPAEHLPHVFDRFYKADPSRTDTGSGPRAVDRQGDRGASRRPRRRAQHARAGDRFRDRAAGPGGACKRRHAAIAAGPRREEHRRRFTDQLWGPALR